MKARKVLAGVVGAGTAVAIAAAPTGAGTASAATSTTADRPTVTYNMRSLGTVNVSTLAAQAKKAKASAATASSASNATRYELDRTRPELSQPTSTAGPVTTEATVPAPKNTPISNTGPGVRGFDGLNAADSRLAYNGNQFTNEPPDGAICQANGVAVETVNVALQFFTSNGILITRPLAANEFFGLPPAIDRTKNPVTFPGPSNGDPRCLYDPGSGRMMILFWATGQNPKTGAFTGDNTFFLAVATSSNPAGSYYRYAIDVDHRGSVGCENNCLADFPMLGSDANSVTISYNSFGLTTTGGFKFNQDRLMVMSKKRLTSGRVGPTARFNVDDVDGLLSYTLQPASIPPGGHYDTRMGGTQWLLESPPNIGGTRQLGLAAVINTKAIDSNPGALRVKTDQFLGPLKHAIPPQLGVKQKPGPRPLGFHLKDFFGVPNEPLPKLDTGFDKASSVQLAAGKLYTAINTRVGGDFPRAGQLLTSVVPGFTSNGDIVGRVAAQHYVAIANGSALYGDLAVSADGRRAAMVASLVSPDFYPAAATAVVNPDTLNVDHLKIYMRGQVPEDGFSCYKAFGGGPCRWGDYSEINFGTDGNVYMMTEYIPDRLRVTFANWGTAIGRFQP